MVWRRYFLSTGSWFVSADSARLTHSGGYHEPVGVYINTSTAVSNTVGVLLRPRRLGSHVSILLLQDFISSSSAKSYPD
jgi:hypothetical protein